jgi:hypothetical protein
VPAFGREVGVPAMCGKETSDALIPSDILANETAPENRGSSGAGVGERYAITDLFAHERLPVGLPFNLRAPRLKDGLRRFVG